MSYNYQSLVSGRRPRDHCPLAHTAESILYLLLLLLRRFLLPPILRLPLQSTPHHHHTYKQISCKYTNAPLTFQNSPQYHTGLQNMNKKIQLKINKEKQNANLFL